MDLASLLFPPEAGAATPLRLSPPGGQGGSLARHLGAAMLVRAAQRQAASFTARCAAELVGGRAPLLAPRHGAFHAVLAACAREWKVM